MLRRTCGDYARVLYYFAREAAGAKSTGIPCALFYRGWIVHQLGRTPRCENADLCLDDVIPGWSQRVGALRRPMTGSGPDPESRDSPMRNCAS
jgi:hypothetical protein